MIIDVDYPTFKKMRTAIYGFYWSEERTRWVLAKVENSTVIRTYVVKKNKQSDMLFRNDLSEHGVLVKRITFDDEMNMNFSPVLASKRLARPQDV